MTTIQRYWKAIAAALGTAASLAVALGWSHEKYVAIALGVLGVLGVIQAPYKAKAAPAESAAGSVKP